MNAVHPKKLLLTKWTAVRPLDRRKHFMVTKVVLPDDPSAAVQWIEIEAVHSGSVSRIAWRDLRNTDVWRQGWV
jgi:tryptophan-rich hypothetical protein